MKMKTDRTSRKLNNSGFSLVELIVVVLLSAVIAFMILGFIEASRTTYQTVDTAAELQSESQAATAMLRDVVSCAMDGGWTSNAGTGNLSDAGNAAIDLSSVGNNKGIFWVEGYDFFDYDVEESTRDYTMLYVFALDNDNVLRFASYNRKTDDITDGSGALSTTKIADKIRDDMLDASDSKYTLLAQHVDRMSIKKVTSSEGSLFTITLDFNYREDFSTTLKVLARNMK